jgi:hypothetical protein
MRLPALIDGDHMDPYQAFVQQIESMMVTITLGGKGKLEAFLLFSFSFLFFSLKHQVSCGNKSSIYLHFQCSPTICCLFYANAIDIFVIHFHYLLLDNDDCS